jgi:hypothetical protein
MEAARYLRSKVYEYMSNELGLPENIQIRVRIHANIKGLASTYYYSKILDSAADLDAFVRGFNMGHPMGDFVDAGDGKECADSKLKGRLKSYCQYSSIIEERQYLTLTLGWFDDDIADVQCQAVICGGSVNNGYARLLQPYVGDCSKNKRIILIEGPPFVKELAGLKDKFRVACFPDIFRHTKLPPRRVSFSKTPPTTPIPDALSYTAIASPLDAAAVRPYDASDPLVTVPERKKYLLLKNGRGQRLDAIISPPQSLVRVLRDKKLCNPFHILGECTYPACTYIHRARLDEKGIEARRLVARQAPCSSGLHCDDKKCLLGHQCPDRACARIGKGCRFTPEMNADKESITL